MIVFFREAAGGKECGVGVGGNRYANVEPDFSSLCDHNWYGTQPEIIWTTILLPTAVWRSSSIAKSFLFRRGRGL